LYTACCGGAQVPSALERCGEKVALQGKWVHQLEEPSCQMAARIIHSRYQKKTVFPFPKAIKSGVALGMSQVSVLSEHFIARKCWMETKHYRPV
jgi:hypothetical protein